MKAKKILKVLLMSLAIYSIVAVLAPFVLIPATRLVHPGVCFDYLLEDAIAYGAVMGLVAQAWYVLRPTTKYA
jgi:hypothetical protein